MDRLNQHGTSACFDVDVTDCSECHPTARIKTVQQTFGRPGSQLLANHPEHFGIDRFELEV